MPPGNSRGPESPSGTRELLNCDDPEKHGGRQGRHGQAVSRFRKNRWKIHSFGASCPYIRAGRQTVRTGPQTPAAPSPGSALSPNGGPGVGQVPRMRLPVLSRPSKVRQHNQGKLAHHPTPRKGTISGTGNTSDHGKRIRTPAQGNLIACIDGMHHGIKIEGAFVVDHVLLPAFTTPSNHSRSCPGASGARGRPFISHLLGECQVGCHRQGTANHQDRSPYSGSIPGTGPIRIGKVFERSRRAGVPHVAAVLCARFDEETCKRFSTTRVVGFPRGEAIELSRALESDDGIAPDSAVPYSSARMPHNSSDRMTAGKCNGPAISVSHSMEGSSGLLQAFHFIFLHAEGVFWTRERTAFHFFTVPGYGLFYIVRQSGVFFLQIGG